jgi:MoxR-like ATPase
MAVGVSFFSRDEINRASPKTQSALLEAMQEQQVTVMGKPHALPHPFFVLATQNPIELEGTYPLPEAQLDRFLLKIEVRRSTVETLEKIVLNRKIGVQPEVPAVLNRDDFDRLLAVAQRIYLPPVVANYIARLVDATHTLGKLGIKYGASPRAALALAAAARSRALLCSRPNASTEDVRAVAAPVLQHRIILDYNARLDGVSTATVVGQLLEEIPAHDLERPRTLLDAKLQ